MAMTNKEKVIQALKSLETGDQAPLRYFSPDRYVQHNLHAADGIAGVRATLETLAALPTKVNIVRLFEEGDFVFAHVEYHLPQPRIGFDIFRFEEGLIVEHWDNLQDTVPRTPSGHTMIDGPTEVQDRDQTAATKKLAAGIVDDILVNGRMETLAGYYDGDHYIQHNPEIPDLVSGLGRTLGEWAGRGIFMKYDTIHRVLGEGNFALIVSEGHLAGRHSAFYDLFRVENGKIAEHWDTIEAIPPATEWKNANGKF
jgi:predicted SnoaL-like aldol condensation-catalyzing enzyme